MEFHFQIFPAAYRPELRSTIAAGVRVLIFHIEDMEAVGEPLPKVSEFEEIRRSRIPRGPSGRGHRQREHCGVNIY
jgi:hypothetical protein